MRTWRCCCRCCTTSAVDWYCIWNAIQCASVDADVEQSLVVTAAAAPKTPKTPVSTSSNCSHTFNVWIDCQLVSRGRSRHCGEKSAKIQNATTDSAARAPVSKCLLLLLFVLLLVYLLLPPTCNTLSTCLEACLSAPSLPPVPSKICSDARTLWYRCRRRAVAAVQSKISCQEQVVDFHQSISAHKALCSASHCSRAQISFSNYFNKLCVRHIHMRAPSSRWRLMWQIAAAVRANCYFMRNYLSCDSVNFLHRYILHTYMYM